MLYPIMTPSRELIDLNGIWNFKLDSGTGLAEGWQGILYVPHAGEILYRARGI